VHTFDEFLNEDYGQMAVNNQTKLVAVADRMKTTKQKLDDLVKVNQGYQEKAGKTKDDIAKNVYASKISSNNARRESYLMYMQYLQAMQNYYQVKAKEIAARTKAADKRKF
jgi:hypothetical protein